MVISKAGLTNRMLMELSPKSAMRDDHAESTPRHYGYPSTDDFLQLTTVPHGLATVVKIAKPVVIRSEFDGLSTAS